MPMLYVCFFVLYVTQQHSPIVSHAETLILLQEQRLTLRSASLHHEDRAYLSCLIITPKKSLACFRDDTDARAELFLPCNNKPLASWTVLRTHHSNCFLVLGYEVASAPCLDLFGLNEFGSAGLPCGSKDRSVKVYFSCQAMW